MTQSNLDRINHHWGSINIWYSDELSENSSKPNARLSARTSRQIGYSTQHTIIYIVLDFSDRWRKKTSISQQIHLFLIDLSSHCYGQNYEVVYVWGGNEISQSNNLDHAWNNRTLTYSIKQRLNLYDWCINQSDYQIILISDCQIDYHYQTIEHQIIVRQLSVPRWYRRASYLHHTQIPLQRPFMTFL